ASGTRPISARTRPPVPPMGAPARISARPAAARAARPAGEFISWAALITHLLLRNTPMGISQQEPAGDPRVFPDPASLANAPRARSSGTPGWLVTVQPSRRATMSEGRRGMLET